MSSEAYFVKPTENPDVTGFPELRIRRADGRPDINISAKAVLQTLEDSDKQKQLIDVLTKSLERERDRIRRLMHALCDEVLKVQE